jgi:hypothetical protein
MTNHLYKSGSVIGSFRLSLYVLISSCYWAFMRAYAPLGIAWRPFHAHRVFNAVNHMVNASPLLSYGFTSWNDLHEVAKTISLGQPVEVYLVSPLSYWIQAALVSANPAIDLSRVGVIGDYLLICCVAALSAEIAFQLIRPHDAIFSLFLPLSAFALFLISPWSYRMMLAPWNEVSWLLFYLITIQFFLLNRQRLGLFLLLVAGFYQWQWSIFVFLFYGIIYVVDLTLDRKVILALLPPGLQSSRGALQLMAVTLFPAIVAFSQGLTASFSSLHIKHSGSSLLFRIGIDSFSNIHHGGILAAMQFLGGNRVSLCFQAQTAMTATNKIAVFNCMASIAGLFVLSLIAIIGYIWLCLSERRYRWITLPALWVFSSFFLLFQQSYAVHLQGYSFVFAFIFAVGFIFLLVQIRKIIGAPPALAALFCLPLVMGVLINFVRVSYITGVNG